MMLNKVIRFFILPFFTFSQWLNAQNVIVEPSNEPIFFKNSSFEGQPGASKMPDSWQVCTTLKTESSADIQPGSFGVRLVPFSGKSFLSLVGNDDGTVEAIQQTLLSPLRGNRCYRLSVYLAKAEKYQNQSRVTTSLSLFDKPLKFVLWGATNDSCVLQPDNWLAETKPIHHNGWKKYVFYIHPPKDFSILVFQVSHVDGKIYNGNMLLDNVSPIIPVNCSDLRISSGTIAGRGASLLMNQLNDVIINNGNYLKFEKKKPNLTAEGDSPHTEENEFKRNKYLDNITAIFEKNPNYKLIIRVKKSGKLTQSRVVYLYNYIFKHTKIKAQQVDIQRFKPKDEEFVWSFENDEITISFDTISPGNL